jgi:hypothetical protein
VSLVGKWANPEELFHKLSTRLEAYKKDKKENKLNPFCRILDFGLNVENRIIFWQAFL